MFKSGCSKNKDENGSNALFVHTHYLLKNKIKQAFTLAETLITLGIIGVVAAMTINTLIQNSQKQATVEKLKKTYSTISNIYAFSSAQNGEWGKLTWTNDTEREELYKTLILSYLNVAKYCGQINQRNCYPEKVYKMNGTQMWDLSTDGTNDYAYILADGTTVMSWLHGNGTGAMFYVDLNGKKAPNILGKDIFAIQIQALPYDSTRTKTGVLTTSTTTPATENPTRDDLITGTFACSKSGTGLNCGRLIQMDSWQIKDDYPW